MLLTRTSSEAYVRKTALSIREDVHQLGIEPDEFLADFISAEHSKGFKFRQILLGGVNTLKENSFFITLVGIVFWRFNIIKTSVIIVLPSHQKTHGRH